MNHVSDYDCSVYAAAVAQARKDLIKRLFARCLTEQDPARRAKLYEGLSVLTRQPKRPHSTETT